MARLLANLYRITHKNWDIMKKFAIAEKMANNSQAVFTGIGGWLGYFLGGCDGLLYALIAFTVIDYISGVMLRDSR